MMYQVFNTETNRVVGTFDNLEAAFRDSKSLNKQTESSKFETKPAPQERGRAKKNGWEYDERVLESRNQTGYEPLLDEEFDSLAECYGNHRARVIEENEREAGIHRSWTEAAYQEVAKAAREYSHQTELR